MPLPLHTARLALRPLTAADAADVFAVYGDPEVLRYWNSDPLGDPGEAARWAAEQGALHAERGFAQWRAGRRDDGAFVGCVGLQPLGDEVELVYALPTASWGRGYAAEAGRAALGYAFEEARLERVVAIARAAHERSLRVLERLTFRPCGPAWYWGSEWLEYRLTAVEWRDGRGCGDPPLLTPRLELRRSGPADLGSLSAVFGDPEVMRFVGESRRPLDVAAVAASQAVVQEHWRTRGFGPLAVVERAGGRVVGEAGLQVLEDGPDVELTYTFARAVWGRGYATEAARAVLRWAFAGLRLPRVVAVARPQNAASLRVVEKAGMRRVGSRSCYGGVLLEYALGLGDWRSRGGAVDSAGPAG
jgi:ribosomal-protein-alanine N-acetyltransferase